MPGQIQKRISSRLLALKKEPRPHGIKKIKGFEDCYRIRIGDYRIVYVIKDNELTVTIVRAAHRKDIYQFAFEGIDIANLKLFFDEP